MSIRGKQLFYFFQALLSEPGLGVVGERNEGLWESLYDIHTIKGSGFLVPYSVFDLPRGGGHAFKDGMVGTGEKGH